MPTAIQKHQKQCVACSYWGGSREAHGGGRITFEAYSKGTCVCNGGPFHRQNMLAHSTCRAWRAWL